MKKGFTLIELLAVIVILAIIAVISTPIVLDIINEAGESSDLISVEFYLDAVEYTIADAILNKDGISNGTYSIMENGNLCMDTLDNKVCSGTELVVKTNGTKPRSGTITIDNGNIINVIVKLENQTIVKNNKEELIYVPEAKSFAEDSWDVIAANVIAGNLSKYNIGDEKEVTLTGFTNEEEGSNGLYTVRIANTSTPSECSTEGFSQTACGFVIEFVDIVTTRVINKNGIDSTNSNKGGWESIEMRSYVNSEIYNSFPKELKESIIDTFVVSGHGSDDFANFETIDKIYLLSPKELWGKESTIKIINNDTAEKETRQLDYYKSIGVTLDNYRGAQKEYNGFGSYWWLRTALSEENYGFFDVSGGGSWDGFDAPGADGVAVAFRLG